MQTDLILIIMPKIQPDAPTVGPAILKAKVQQHGYSCKVFDLNIDSYNAIQNKDIWNKDDYLFLEDNYEKFLSDYTELKSIKKLHKEYIKKLVELNPRYVGLSLLTKFSRNSAFYFSKLVKNALPNTKIIWGGAGIYKSYCLNLIKDEIIDDFILGDAEEQIIKLLNGTLDTDKTKRHPIQLQDLNSVPLPDYSDIIWNNYQKDDHFKEKNISYITASRGCVRNCSFCDINLIWPKFKFRSAENVFEEIKYIHQTYKRTFFKFTDSLINGSQSEFRKLLFLLANYRKNYPEIQWSSQFIAKSERQMPKDDFVLIKESGCVWLEIGFEHLVEKIRFDMNKKITDEDMWYTIDECFKNNIIIDSLMITGWITETEEDHIQQLNVLKEMFDRGYKDTINFAFGNVLSITENTPLWSSYINDPELEWINLNDWNYKGNTLDVRIRRWEEVNEYYKKLRAEQNKHTNINLVASRVKKLKDHIDVL